MRPALTLFASTSFQAVILLQFQEDGKTLDLETLSMDTNLPTMDLLHTVSSLCTGEIKVGLAVGELLNQRASDVDVKQCFDSVPAYIRPKRSCGTSPIPTSSPSTRPSPTRAPPCPSPRPPGTRKTSCSRRNRSVQTGDDSNPPEASHPFHPLPLWHQERDAREQLYREIDDAIIKVYYIASIRVRLKTRSSHRSKQRPQQADLLTVRFDVVGGHERAAFRPELWVAAARRAAPACAGSSLAHAARRRDLPTLRRPLQLRA